MRPGERRTRRGLLLGAGALVMAGGVPAWALADTWETVAHEDGIHVTSREVEGRDMPTFRGVGIIQAEVDEILAVLTDVDRHTEWMHRCVASKILERKSDTVRYVYNRVDSPWPAADRDVVLRTEIFVREPHQEIHTKFRAVETRMMGRIDGVVRMPTLEGHYKFRRLGPRRTRVEYQVDADPGGRLPRWLVRIATKDLPLRTIRNLRRQVERTLGEYDDVVHRWKVTNPSHGE